MANDKRKGQTLNEYRRSGHDTQVVDEMRDLLTEVFEQIECFDANSHNAGTCLCKRVKAAIERSNPR